MLGFEVGNRLRGALNQVIQALGIIGPIFGGMARQLGPIDRLQRQIHQSSTHGRLHTCASRDSASPPDALDRSARGCCDPAFAGR
jgi:hypothetical protein